MKPALRKWDKTREIEIPYSANVTRCIRYGRRYTCYSWWGKANGFHVVVLVRGEDGAVYQDWVIPVYASPRPSPCRHMGHYIFTNTTTEKYLVPEGSTVFKIAPVGNLHYEP